MDLNIQQPLRLSVGSHRAGSGKGCVMNVVSWENGDQTITDFPGCADPLLARVAQRVNDSHCTHRDGDLLCALCSIEVLALGHRTVGTALVGWSAVDRADLYAKIAREEADSVAHLKNADAAYAAAYDGDAVRSSIRLQRAHALFDRFEELTGVRAQPVASEAVTEAVEKMLAVTR